MTVVMIHGNSADSRVFAPQFASPAAERFHMVAVDLPGHGKSDNASDPQRTYTMKGYADTIVEVLGEMGIDRAAVFGWSLGGHVAMEMADKYQGMVGMMLTGAPPVSNASAEAIMAGFQPSEHAGLIAQPELAPEEAAIFAYALFGDPQSEMAHESIARTDGMARAVMFGDFVSGGSSDQRRVVEEARVPVAFVNGENDMLVNLDYVSSLSCQTLWEDHHFVLRGAGHAPFMQAPDVFNAIFERFCADMSVLRPAGEVDKTAVSAA